MKPHDLALRALKPFLSTMQFAALLDNTSERCEEHAYFRDLVATWANRIETMPKTYEQDGKGDDAVAHLHYFFGGCDWYITENDMAGPQHQAFGFAVLNGDAENAELGYISIEQLRRAGAEFDLYFESTSLRDIKRKHGIT